MNRFLKKKDAPAAHDEAVHGLPQPSAPQLKKSSASKWKKNKKPLPEVRPQIDLTMALPSTDDFRTSLLMPSLSTRFSMLREQDDPSSLLGKASDDSVLQPRRRSRLGDFGLSSGGLGDIAEVSSIHDSIRPPFAERGREQSDFSEDGYSSDADAHIGNIMARSRPGEGNVLFGGRQKIYKIPTSGAVSTKSLGRLVYDDDVGMSAFQKYRHQRERDQDDSQLPRPSDESQGFDFGLDRAEADYQDDDGQRSVLNDSAKDLCHSPSLSSYDRKRSTTSSDARSVARSSTAATSVASHTAASVVSSPVTTTSSTMSSTMPTAATIDRSNTKGRRLYEQGLDQHMQEQQTSAITRLNSIQRQRAMSGKKTPPFLHSTKSASNLQERTASPVFALRGQSPPLTSPFGSIKHAKSASPSLIPSGPHSPVDGQNDEHSVLAQALEPADRGKATALGAFNKPAHAFDEQKYLERQKQLQRSASNAALRNKTSTAPSPTQVRFDRFEHEQALPRKGSPEPSSRSFSDSAKRRHEPTTAYNVFQNALNQFPAQPVSKSPLPDTHRTFFGNISASEDEDEEEVSEIAQSFNQPEYGYGYHGKWQPTILPSVSEHPTLRNQTSKTSLAEEDEGDHGTRSLNHARSSPSTRNFAIRTGVDVPKALDSPTLGPAAHSIGGMNGMVHHLRQQSDQSSVYQGDNAKDADNYQGFSETTWNVSQADDDDGQQGRSLDAPASMRESLFTPSNPWDLDEANSLLESNQTPNNESSDDPSTRQSGTSLHPSGHDSASERSSTQEGIPAWQQELRKQHTRDASSATMQERDAFSRELAARRDAVKENLRSVVEVNASRSASPLPSPLNVPNNSLRALGMLRAKTSRESLGNARDQSRPLKTVGIAAATPGNNDSTDRAANTMDVGRSRGNSSPRLPMPPTSQHPAYKNAPFEQAKDEEIPPQRQLASSRLNGLGASTRSRSNSATTNGRSLSRTGHYRDDLDKAMTEGRGVSANLLESTPDASPGLVPSRDSDGIKAGMQAYLDLKAKQNGPTPVGTPTTLPPNGFNPGRPVPMAKPYSENPTPPLSGPTSLANVAAYSPVIPSSARGSGLRKRTITKSNISEPTLISSTSNVETVDLPPGASLKNGMEDNAPPIPPFNPRRRGTRKLFGLAGKGNEENAIPQTTRSDPNLLLPTSPKREPYIAPGNIVRLQAIETGSPPMQQYGMGSLPSSPERARAVATPLNGGMF